MLCKVSVNELELLSLRSKLSPTITYVQLYLVKYSGFQWKCCNAFEQHKTCKSMTKSLRTIT